jgi:hypothetical protein
MKVKKKCFIYFRKFKKGYKGFEILMSKNIKMYRYLGISIGACWL